MTLSHCPADQRIFEHAGLTVLRDEASGSRVTYHPAYLDEPTASALFDWMVVHTPWQREVPVLFGKPHEVRRRTCAYGERGLTYRYSGIDRVAVEWPDRLRLVVDRLSGQTGARFNFGLCNFYADGEAYVGKHADAERDVVRDTPIVGLSLGAARDFVLYDHNDRRVADVTLAHGSIVVMWGGTQKHFKHAIPRRRRVSEARISITFRVIAARVSGA